jgi:Fe-S oxidoreductase
MSFFDVAGVTGRILFWAVTFIAFGVFFRRMIQLVKYMLLGKKEESYRRYFSRALATFGIFIGQWCQMKNVTAKNRAGVGHIFMAWGFFGFVTFYFLFIILGGGFGLSESLEHTTFFFYYAWVMDILAMFVFTGALWGLIRRFVVRPARLEGEQTLEALVILLSVLVHPLTHLGKEATGIAMGGPLVTIGAQLGAPLPPISDALSHLFTGLSNIPAANVAFFWAHWLTVLFVLIFIAYSRYLHVVASLFNVFLRSPMPIGTLKTINLETAESFGASKITDFTWKQLLDLYACVVCGQCQDVCPAKNSGKTLNPKKVIQDLKKDLLKEGPGLVAAQAMVKAAPSAAPAVEAPVKAPLAGSVITEDEIWACTTCRACDSICPVSVDHIDKIVDLRRNLVLERSQMPEPVQQALQCLATREHPWKGTAATRTDWTKGLAIKMLAENPTADILFWVGCTAALEERNMKVAISMAKIMQAAGIDFAILGTQEVCCGDPARRMGDEYQFQTLCQKNIETFKSFNVKKIVTTCPHCFNTFNHEYPQFGGNYEVIHHTQFLTDLIDNGKIKVGRIPENKVVTYHDSCYLGRYNNIFQQPRKILASIGGLKKVEMTNSKSDGFCCGGGGGHMWMEEEPDKRVNVKRAEQALETKAGLIATACPYCLSMFEDGIKTKGAAETVQVKDLSELVLQALVTEKSK